MHSPCCVHWGLHNPSCAAQRERRNKNFLCRGKRGGRRSHMLREALMSALHKMQESRAAYPQIPALWAGILVRFRSAPLHTEPADAVFRCGRDFRKRMQGTYCRCVPVGATCGRPLGGNSPSLPDLAGVQSSPLRDVLSRRVCRATCGRPLGGILRP